MLKRILLVSTILGSALPLLAQGSAQIVTLPAAASIVGLAPFFSDVRAFNTSYTDSVNVTANYRCFIPATGCVAATPTVPFTLAPRESRAFNDIVAQTFGAPNTAGGVEFTYTGDSEQLVVTSRLYSTAPTPTVGMFIPGLSPSDAFANTVLLQVQNAGAGAGFRTNVGVFNPNDAAVSVTFQIFDGGTDVLGNAVPLNVAPHTGAQINQIFAAAGQGTAATANAVVRVTASAPIFSYAAVIDNNTTDPIFVVGAEDQPPQAFTPVATQTPAVSATPTPPAPTATPTPGGGAQTANVNIGSDFFQDQSSGSSTTTIHAGDSVKWTWIGSPHSTTSGSCPGGACNPDGNWNSGINSTGHTFTHQFTQTGTFPYFCLEHLSAMQGTVIVNP